VHPVGGLQVAQYPVTLVSVVQVVTVTNSGIDILKYFNNIKIQCKMFIYKFKIDYILYFEYF
jgi:hypothetical protein